MAHVSITRHWPDGDKLSVRVDADTVYPDHLDDARTIAIRAYAEALGVTLCWDDADAEDRD